MQPAEGDLFPQGVYRDCMHSSSFQVMDLNGIDLTYISLASSGVLYARTCVKIVAQNHYNINAIRSNLHKTHSSYVRAYYVPKSFCLFHSVLQIVNILQSQPPNRMRYSSFQLQLQTAHSQGIHSLGEHKEIACIAFSFRIFPTVCKI